MSSSTRTDQGLVGRPPQYVGPGIVVAATGVGAGDLVATLIAGSNASATPLLWAAVLGCLVKISLAEAAGRWQPLHRPHPLRRLGESLGALDDVLLRRRTS